MPTQSTETLIEEAVKEILRKYAVDDLGEDVVNGIAKELSTIASKSAEEKHEHNFEVLNPSVHSGGSTYSTIFCTKCGGKKIPHELKEQQ